ncbi:TPA: hypothetical protein HA219_00935 [Candidatus Woesearchaeota archaeon]|nr:hypothetical protein [Candidatus Woesearchaeota archaeon]HIH39275.1 hypothetical protein [Candidatus Woesearchaeota archaeon]
MLNTKSIAQLNRALENSFGNIKKDMNEIKFALSSQAEQQLTLKKNLDAARTEVVTTDKFNVLKIKIGEINEGLKKVWDLEKQLRVMGGSKTLQEATDELSAKVAALNVKIDDVNRKNVSETQMKTVVEQINSELNRMAVIVREAEQRRDLLRRQDIEEHTRFLAKRIASTNEDLANLRKACVTKDDIKGVLNDVSKDFASIRKDIEAVAKREASFVKDTEVKKILDDINKEFEGMSNEISSLKKQNKENISVNQIKGLINDISDEFNDVRKDMSRLGDAKTYATRKEIEDVKKDLRNKVSSVDFTRELRQIERNLEKQEVPEDDTYGASVVLDTKAPAKRMAHAAKSVSHRKKYVFGNFLIFAAFAALIGSIYSFYIGNQLLMDRLAIGAVASFVIGMALRAYAIIKGK